MVLCLRSETLTLLVLLSLFSSSLGLLKEKLAKTGSLQEEINEQFGDMKFKNLIEINPDDMSKKKD